jgi:hypothetical protein
MTVDDMCISCSGISAFEADFSIWMGKVQVKHWQYLVDQTNLLSFLLDFMLNHTISAPSHAANAYANVIESSSRPNLALKFQKFCSATDLLYPPNHRLATRISLQSKLQLLRVSLLIIP